MTGAMRDDSRKSSDAAGEGIPNVLQMFQSDLPVATEPGVSASFTPLPRRLSPRGERGPQLPHLSNNH